MNQKATTNLKSFVHVNDINNNQDSKSSLSKSMLRLYLWSEICISKELDKTFSERGIMTRILAVFLRWKVRLIRFEKIEQALLADEISKQKEMSQRNGYYEPGLSMENGRKM